MPFKLKIVFGGLCMFVEREKSEKGLYVLMPLMRHGHPDHDHFPTLLFDPVYADPPKVCAGKCKVPLADGTQVEIGDMNAHGAKNGPPPHVGDASTYAGGKPVDPKWFTGKPSECLAVRVRLPLGLRVRATGGLAKLKVTFGGSTKRLELVGLAAVNNIPIAGKQIQIGNTKLVPRKSKLEIMLVNLTKADIDDLAAERLSVRPKPKPNEPVPHFQRYYHLLERSCNPPVGGPDLFVDDEPDAGLRMAGVDPYRCTIGFGGEP